MTETVNADASWWGDTTFGPLISGEIGGHAAVDYHPRFLSGWKAIPEWLESDGWCRTETGPIRTDMALFGHCITSSK